MAADLIRFVDSIVASPTVRLDLNDETSWWVKKFDAPPPRLRHSVAENAMRDGVHVGSSSYSGRTLVIELECRKSTQDAAAIEIQKLWRELDRANNFLMYQPNTLTKPVFFRTYRSDASQLADVMAQQAMRQFTIEVLAEPFALGLAETFSGTFSWDGASSSGFKASSIPTVIGDVAAPLVLDVTLTNLPASAWLVAQAVPSSLTSPDVVRAGTNASLGTAGTDTSFVTGLPNTYWNTNAAAISFATNAAMATRLSGIAPSGFYGGTYRLLAHVFESSAGAGVYSVRALRSNSAGATGNTIDNGQSVAVQVTGVTGGPIDAVVDMGLFRVPFGTDQVTQASGSTVSGSYWGVEAARTSGTLHVDGLLWVPTLMDDAARNTTAVITPPVSASATTPQIMRVDAGAESVYIYTGSLAVSDQVRAASVAGALPSLLPGCTNTLWLIPTRGTASGGTATSTTIAYSASYNPRYMFVRPVSS